MREQLEQIVTMLDGIQSVPERTAEFAQIKGIFQKMLTAYSTKDKSVSNEELKELGSTITSLTIFMSNNVGSIPPFKPAETKLLWDLSQSIEMAMELRNRSQLQVPPPPPGPPPLSALEQKAALLQVPPPPPGPPPPSLLEDVERQKAAALVLQRQQAGAVHADTIANAGDGVFQIGDATNNRVIVRVERSQEVSTNNPAEQWRLTSLGNPPYFLLVENTNNGPLISFVKDGEWQRVYSLVGLSSEYILMINNASRLIDEQRRRELGSLEKVEPTVALQANQFSVSEEVNAMLRPRDVFWNDTGNLIVPDVDGHEGNDNRVLSVIYYQSPPVGIPPQLRDGHMIHSQNSRGEDRFVFIPFEHQEELYSSQSQGGPWEPINFNSISQQTACAKQIYDRRGDIINACYVQNRIQVFAPPSAPDLQEAVPQQHSVSSAAAAAPARRPASVKVDYNQLESYIASTKLNMEFFVMMCKVADQNGWDFNVPHPSETLNKKRDKVLTKYKDNVTIATPYGTPSVTTNSQVDYFELCRMYELQKQRGTQADHRFLRAILLQAVENGEDFENPVNRLNPGKELPSAVKKEREKLVGIIMQELGCPTKLQTQHEMSQRGVAQSVAQVPQAYQPHKISKEEAEAAYQQAEKFFSITEATPTYIGASFNVSKVELTKKTGFLIKNFQAGDKEWVQYLAAVKFGDSGWYPVPAQPPSTKKLSEILVKHGVIDHPKPQSSAPQSTAAAVQKPGKK